MIALVDGDLVAYRCAASCQKQGVVVEDLGIAQARANNLLTNIQDAVAQEDVQIFLSGQDNFRKTLNPQYKANRKDMERPVYLEPLREWLVVEWGAQVTEGIEADDALGIHQTKYNAAGVGSIICSLDKDLLQVPGEHYSWEIFGTSATGNQWNRPAARRTVSPMEGLFNFYWQIVMGDASDNVPGYDGKMRQKVPKFLEQHYENMQVLETEQELFDYVKELYQLPLHDLLLNGTCLWIQREEGEDWRQKGKQLLSATLGTGDNGQKGVSEPSLPPLSEQVAADGSLNMTP